MRQLDVMFNKETTNNAAEKVMIYITGKTVVTPLLKKTVKKDCKHYKGIYLFLIDNSYKVVSNIFFKDTVDTGYNNIRESPNRVYERGFNYRTCQCSKRNNK